MTTLVELKQKDDEEFNDFERINIKMVCNGWVVETTDSEGEEYIEVFTFDKADELMKCIKETVGID